MLHDNNHVRPANKDEVVRKLMPDTISECSLTANSGVCSSTGVITALQKITGESSAVTAVDSAKKKTGCSTELCAVTKMETPIVNLVGQQVFIDNITNNFKVAGPVDNTWLSNVNIDAVMAQWAAKFPEFYAYNFNMRNYMDYSFKNNVLVEAPDTLATISFCSLMKEGYKCAACIINSDRYQGRGTHWMAIFVDARSQNATCEFFNSAGSDPVPEFVSFLVKTKKCIGKAEIVKVSRRQHQQSTTECGVYSLFYVWARLNGVPYTYFMESPVDDQLMFEFRHHLFANDQVGNKFSWSDFTKKVAVSWEK